MAEEKQSTDVNQLKKIVAMMVENDIVEVEIINGDDKIYFRRPEPQSQFVNAVPMQQAPVAAMQAAPAAAAPVAVAAAPAVEDNLPTIKSPIVGTFYSAPSPDSEPYAKVGGKVTPDTVVCIVEAMKVMNEIKAETSGTIVEILVQNGEAVEYDQPLFKIKS